MSNHIVVLDGYTLNPGDLSWDALESLGEVEIFEHTPAEEIVSRARDASIVLTNKAALSRDVIEALPNLRFIGVLATGYNIVDLGAARERGIPVSNVPEYSTNSVAQMVFAHVFTLCRRVELHADTVREGRWAGSRDFAYWDTPQRDIEGLTLGLVGFGKIGRAVARAGQAFGMRVIAYAPSFKESCDGVKPVSLDEVFALSDVVSLHCPLTDSNAGLVSAERLDMMKPTAFLINTGRGPLIDERALADALNEGRLAGAGLDVLSVEPPAADNPLYEAANCFITPHIAWATRTSRQRLLDATLDNIRAFVDGKPVNVVS